MADKKNIQKLVSMVNSHLSVRLIKLRYLHIHSYFQITRSLKHIRKARLCQTQAFFEIEIAILPFLLVVVLNCTWPIWCTCYRSLFSLSPFNEVSTLKGYFLDISNIFPLSEAPVSEKKMSKQIFFSGPESKKNTPLWSESKKIKKIIYQTTYTMIYFTSPKNTCDGTTTIPPSPPRYRTRPGSSERARGVYHPKNWAKFWNFLPPNL